MTAQNLDFDVFLCHNHKDKPVVRQLADALEKSGLRPYLDEEALSPGLPWRKELERVLQRVPSAAVLLGSQGLGNVQDLEVTFLLGESGRRRLSIIPVLLPNGPAQTGLPPLLQSFQWIDLREGFTPDGLERLVRGIRGNGEPNLFPAPSLPVSRNLPFPSLGSLFKGRNEELRYLAEGNPAGATQVILGLAGVGKTRLAVEYAWRYGMRYIALLFVSAESPEGLSGQLALLGRFDILGLPVRAPEEAEFVVRRWLKEHYRWLLILDGVDTEEAADRVMKLLPDLKSGHVLITSRFDHWPPDLQADRSLSPIRHDEAVRFLLDRTAARRLPAEDDAAQAGRLAEILDGLPLALEQIGAYISSRRTTFTACLKDWEEQRERLLGWHDRIAMGHLPLAVTWQQIFQQLSLGSAALLRLAAHLTPEPIPVEMFRCSRRIVEAAGTALRDETGREASSQTLEAALEDLASYSMLSLRGAEIRVHAMVQEVVLALIPPARRRDWAERALAVVDDFAPTIQNADWDVLLPHALRVLKHAGTADLSQSAAHLTGLSGLALKEKTRYAEAEPLLRQVLEQRETLLGPAHPDLVADLAPLADLAMAMSRWPEAESLYRRILALHEVSYGPSHPEVALALSNLAGVLTTTGRPAEAEPLYRRALAIDAEFLGPTHPRIATALYNLASLLKSVGRADDAEPLLRRALLIDETALGPDHDSVGYGLRRLGDLLRALDRFWEAEPLLRRAVAIFEKTRDAKDPIVEELRATLEPSSSPSPILDVGRKEAPVRRRFIDFLLELGSPCADQFTVTVAASPAGQGQELVHLPLLAEDPWGPLRELRNLEDQTQEHIGEDIFQKVFTGKILDLWRRSREAAEGPEVCLRLKLHIDPRHHELELLAGLPWELLYDTVRGEFLALDAITIIRTVETLQPKEPMRLMTRLRVIVAAASPSEAGPGGPLRSEELGSSLSAVSTTFLPHVTPASLREMLLLQEAHVLYLTCPGDLDIESGEAVLLLESENDGTVRRSGRDLADLLRGLGLRLVVLQIGGENRQPTATVLALALVRAGVPAVLAMQFPVSTESAAIFMTSVLRRLAAGEPVDAAVLEGRRAVRAHAPQSAEWASPALFLSTPDGRLFDAPAPDPLPSTSVREHVLDFSRFIEDKTAGFVGRRWVFEALDRFFRENPRGYFLLRGVPGVGKSALMAELVRRRGYLHHFNLRAEGVRQPETFLANLCAQLILRYELPYTLLPPSATQDSRFLSSLLGLVSRKLLLGERAVLIVDALDEASDPVSLGANPLYLPSDLPPGVFIVVTSRWGGSDLRVACELQVLDLEEAPADNVADIRNLVASRLSRPGIQAYMEAQSLKAGTFVEELVARSQGNFMYLRYVLGEIESGSYGDRSFISIPVGLRNYYEDHWRRMRARDEHVWLVEQLPVLVALTVAREAIPVDLIAAFSGIQDLRRVEAILQDWEPFLHNMERTEGGQAQKYYRLYHESFHDFITGKDEVADERVNLTAAHKRIADVLWRDLFGAS